MKRNKPMRKMSKRRKAESLEYARLSRRYLESNPICEVWLANNKVKIVNTGWGLISEGAPVSIGPAQVATEIHHKCCGKNRKATYLRTDTWMAVSRAGHRFIHDNPKLAYERGWLLKTIPEPKD